MNNDQYLILKTELLAGHPITGAYNADDALAADQLNAVNEPNANSLESMINYMLTIKHKTGQGADTTYTPVIGRMISVAESVLGGDPFGRGAGNEVNLQQIHACKTLVLLIQSGKLIDMDFTNANLPMGYLNGAGVISPAHKTALEDLSKNQISRAREIGLPKVWPGDVEYARTL